MLGGSTLSRSATARSVALITTCALLCLARAVALASPAAQTVTLAQDVNGYTLCTDNHLQENSPNSNYGASNIVYVRYDAVYPNDRVTLIRYDLTGQIPANACIKSATLRVYQYADSNIGAAEWLKIGAYRLLKDWDETGSSWNYRHTGGVDPWQVPAARGVQIDDGDRHHTHHVDPPYVGIADSVVTCTDGVRWLEFDVTCSVQYWHAVPSENHGIVLDWWHEGTPSSDGNNGVNLCSSEYDSTDYRPQLVISYVIPEPEPEVVLTAGSFDLDAFDADPGITFSRSGSFIECAGATSDTEWGPDGAQTTFTLDSSFEASIKVRLQQGIVGADHGVFGFEMWQSATRYIRLLAVGHGARYYEISGNCAASGNGEPHDGTAYWYSYWDGNYPTYPAASPAVRFFEQTPENEAADYLTWTIRYDKTNSMFYVFVNGVMVTYYSKIDFTAWRLNIVHANDVGGVPTTVMVELADGDPPSPDPMTWASPPVATGTSEISMTATTATDDHPPVQYLFTEVTGQPGGSSSAWQTSVTYQDTGLSENTRYGYRVKSRDSMPTPNETAYSAPDAFCYTLISAPQGVSAANPTATTVELSAIGSFPNMAEGETGVQFEGGDWTGDWKKDTKDTATGLTPNTPYTFRARSRNGDGIETDWSAGTGSVRTLAAAPTPLPYGPITKDSIQANWGANGNPSGTEYFCEETTTSQNSGWITHTSWNLGGLAAATQYRFRTKARSAEGIETDWLDLGPVYTDMTIGTLKTKVQPGQLATLAGKVVTAVFWQHQLVYAQDAESSGRREGAAGIAVRVPPTAPVLQEGSLIDVTGQLRYDDAPYDQELVIDASAVRLAGQSIPPRPIGLNGRTCGGGTLGFQPGVVDDVTSDPARASQGLNTVGLLIRQWGWLRDGGLLPSYAWVDDGSLLNDGNSGSAPGICVNLSYSGAPSAVYPAPAVVGGILRCKMADYNGQRFNVREIWPRGSGDILILR